MTKDENLYRLFPAAAACETHFAAPLSESELLCVSSWSLPPRDTYRPWHHIWNSAYAHAQANAPQLFFNSSQQLTPALHLGLADWAFSVTLDQVRSLFSASQTTELFYFLLFWIKLYGDCRGLFDSALRCSRSQPECFQHVLKCPVS